MKETNEAHTIPCYVSLGHGSVRSRVPAATWGLAMSPLDCRCQVSERAGQARLTSPDTQMPRLSPRLFAGVVALEVGGATCAVLAGGVVKCWGLNDNGGLGTGDTINRDTPTGVTGLGAGRLCVTESVLLRLGVPVDAYQEFYLFGGLELVFHIKNLELNKIGVHNIA